MNNIKDFLCKKYKKLSVLNINLSIPDFMRFKTSINKSEELIIFLYNFDSFKEYIDISPYFSILNESYDWNQKRIVTDKIKEILIFSFLIDINIEYTDVIKKVKKFISNELPFYTVDISKNKNYIDYRDNLYNLVYKNILVRGLCGDTDHFHDCHVGAKLLNLDNNGKVWYSLIFGNSYRSHWATIFFQIVPEPWNVEIHKLKEWCDKHYKKFPFGKDCKWQKFKFSEFIKSAQKLESNVKSLGYENLYSYFKHESNKFDDPNINYKNLKQIIVDNLDYTGRFTSFLMMQQLYEFFDWNIDGTELDLNDESTWSCRIGITPFVYNLHDYSEKFIIESGKLKPNKETFEKYNQIIINLKSSLNSLLPFKTNIFELESILCEITDKYLLKSKEFCFWTSIEKNKLLYDAYNSWKDYSDISIFKNIPDLKLILIPQISKRPRFLYKTWADDKTVMKTLNNLGLVSCLDFVLNSEIDVFSELNIKNLYYVSSKFSEICDENFTKEEIEEIQKTYDPRLFLRWKKSLNGIDLSSLNKNELKFIKELSNESLYHKMV